jgi:hypothetical protein
MIIMWRGWGILVVVMCGLGGGLAGSLSKGNMVAVGFGLAASATGTWYLGRWLNQIRPKTAYEAAVEHRAGELRRIVEVGAYQFPGRSTPESVGEAHAMAEEQWKYEAATARAGYFNRHTLFFIPMHYWGALIGLVALITIAFGFIHAAAR